MRKTQIACIFIRNSVGQFFVHQRLANKKTHPNKYGIGAGGHIEEGEEPIAGARRELLEETGLTALVIYHFTMEFDEEGIDPWMTHLFITEADEPIQTDSSEWQWSGWMNKEEVDQLNTEGKLCTDTGVLWERYMLERK